MNTAQMGKYCFLTIAGSYTSTLWSVWLKAKTRPCLIPYICLVLSLINYGGYIGPLLSVLI